MSLQSGQPLAHYRLDRKIGEGGMGEVWAATDTRLHRAAAIKALPASVAGDPERLARFKREAQVLAALSHPNIAAIFGLEEMEGAPYLAMELVEGEDLSTRIERGPVPVDEAVDIALQIAAALEEAHDKGIVHRDLKPANIKVTPDGKVKVLDFGLAKAIEGDGSRSQDSSPSFATMTSPAMTAMGMILGTAAYMSPEQARARPVDKRADIWAFGVVLYEMLTGRRAFAGETVSDVIAAVLTRDFDWTALPTNTPPALRKVLVRCLERDPKKRLRDIGDARVELEAGVADASSQQAGPAAAPARSASRTALLVAGTGLAAAALTFVVMSLAGGPTPTVDVMVFPVAAPPDTRLAQVVVSPDGRSLAFIAESADGVNRLWIRRLDSRDARQLNGTDGARDPFWSPDSRFIGYFTEAQLSKVDVSTGVVEPLAPAPSSTRGGAWSRENTIVFGGEDLLRISASGGRVSTALAYDAASGENAIRYPAFLPGGSRVLFYSRNAKDRALAGLWVVSLETGDRRHLTAVASSSGLYVEPGVLLYRRDRYLVAHPFDVERLEFTGEPTPVAEDLWYEPGVTAQTDVSASDTGIVTFRTGGPEKTDMAWIDRTGRLLGTVWEPNSFVTVGLSRDGTQVLAGFPNQGPERRVWLYDIPTGTARQITSSGDNNGNTLFSEDGTRAVLGIAETRRGMWITRPGSGEAPEMLAAEGYGHATDWRGTQLIHETVMPGSNNLSLRLVDLSTGGERVLVDSSANEAFGTISSDGRWLAYSSDESGQWDVYVQTFPEPAGRWKVSTGGGHQPRWNPRGGELFYLAPDRRMMSVGVRTAGPVFQWDTPRPLFQTDIVDLGPYRGSWGYAVAPDGDRFLILTRRPQGPSPAVAIVNWR